MQLSSELDPAGRGADHRFFIRASRDRCLNRLAVQCARDGELRESYDGAARLVLHRRDVTRPDVFLACPDACSGEEAFSQDRPGLAAEYDGVVVSSHGEWFSHAGSRSTRPYVFSAAAQVFATAVGCGGFVRGRFGSCRGVRVELAWPSCSCKRYPNSPMPSSGW